MSELWSNVVAGRSFSKWREFPDSPENRQFLTSSICDRLIERGLKNSHSKLDRSTQLAWLAADEARRHADLDVDPRRLGVFFGSSRGPILKQIESLELRGSPSLVVTATFGSISGALAQDFAACGPGMNVSATCASGAFAIAAAANAILLGQADAVIAGGTEACLHPSVLSHFKAAGVLGDHPDEQLACRPFDRDRNGLVPGEGAGCLVLESASSARARGAKPIACLRGWSTAMDRAGRANVGPDGETLLDVMRGALELGGITHKEVDHINTHGTGTFANDLAESRAIAELLGPRATMVPCVSTKPVTGHCFGATPALEAVICTRVLTKKVIPPTAGSISQDPECRILVNRAATACPEVRTILSNSLGFWGYHASLLIGCC